MSDNKNFGVYIYDRSSLVITTLFNGVKNLIRYGLSGLFFWSLLDDYTAPTGAMIFYALVLSFFITLPINFIFGFQMEISVGTWFGAWGILTLPRIVWNDYRTWQMNKVK